MKQLWMMAAAWTLAVGAASAQAPDVAVEYYHVDAVGSVRAVTDQSGNVVRRHDYFPFGDGPVQVTAGTDPIRFTGKQRDAETGLDYVGARYYAQHSGRLTTVDPVLNTEAALIDPQRWNRYSYALNNPTAYVDQDGRDPQRARAALLAVDSAAAYFGPVAWATAGALTAGYLVYENREAIAETVVGAREALGAGVVWIKDSVTGADAKPVRRSGSSGGPGEGKDFSQKTKDQTRAKDQETCVFCGEKTTREAGPKQSNIDHAVSKKQGGNNSPENAQNTCRDCNLEKGAKTTEEHLTKKGRIQ